MASLSLLSPSCTSIRFGDSSFLSSQKISSARNSKVGSNFCKNGQKTFFASASQKEEKGERPSSSRRELILNSTTALSLAAIFSFRGERPNYIGVRSDPPSLALCPPSPNCISTSEELNDPTHYVPPWSYNPEDGRGRKSPISQTQALTELVEAIESTKPDGFTPTIITKTADYVYVEYESPTFGFVDDVEFWFPSGGRSLVEYRSASRIGESDGDINRKRIRTLRKELEKKGWESVGF